MTDSTHLKLPYLAPGQAQKHITHNEALAALDLLTQLAVLDRDLSAPPPTPNEGDRYIVAAGASGDWTGKGGQVAAWRGGDWSFFAPEPGWTAFLADETGLVTWTGTGWEAVIGLDGSLPRLGINTDADPANRLAVKSDAVLLSHDDVTPGSGDLRLTLNKAASGNTTSALFQTGYSGRAEIGTAGDDRLSIKVSADGMAWMDALVVDPATSVLEVGGPLRLRSYAVAGLPPAVGAGQLIYVADEAGGPVLAFSDGTSWRRVTDLAMVS